MPVYDFVCECGQEVEIFRSMDKCTDPVRCHCGKLMKRVYNKVNVCTRGAGKSVQALLGRQKMPDIRTKFEDDLGAEDLPPSQWKWKHK